MKIKLLAGVLMTLLILGGISSAAATDIPCEHGTSNGHGFNVCCDKNSLSSIYANKNHDDESNDESTVIIIIWN